MKASIILSLILLFSSIAAADDQLPECNPDFWLAVGIGQAHAARNDTSLSNLTTLRMAIDHAKAWQSKPRDVVIRNDLGRLCEPDFWHYVGLLMTEAKLTYKSLSAEDALLLGVSLALNDNPSPQ